MLDVVLLSAIAPMMPFPCAVMYLDTFKHPQRLGNKPDDIHDLALPLTEYELFRGSCLFVLRADHHVTDHSQSDPALPNVP